MSIVCAAIKNGVVAISADTLSSLGSTVVSASHKKNSDKLYSINKSVVGIVGWQSVSNILEHMMVHQRELFQLGSRMEIFSTLLQLQEKFKEEYFLNTSEEDDQPVESNQLTALVVNRMGIFGIGSYREVNEYSTYWAIGSGRRFALGAMHAVYNKNATARSIAEAGVKAASEFEESCGLPLKTRTIRLA